MIQAIQENNSVVIFGDANTIRRIRQQVIDDFFSYFCSDNVMSLKFNVASQLFNDYGKTNKYWESCEMNELISVLSCFFEV